MKTTLPAVLWTVLVLAASSDLFSSAHSGALLARFGFPPAADFVVRKTAHVVEYAILAWLWFRALRGSSSARWTLRWAVLAVVIAAAVAVVDEVHQAFVPSRTSSAWDVGLDVLGAVTATGVAGVAGVARFRGFGVSRRSR